jgi:bisphosphoglycerate-independent phosphoglycerate mutase (AlkP superfamily)
VQIRELMERCSKLEGEKYSYREELSQTKAASESIFHELSILQGRYSEVDFCAAEKYKLEKARGEELVVEIEKWKGRYAALERTRAEEQESMRRVMEAQREAVGSREAKDLLSRF